MLGYTKAIRGLVRPAGGFETPSLSLHPFGARAIHASAAEILALESKVLSPYMADPTGVAAPRVTQAFHVSRDTSVRCSLGLLGMQDAGHVNYIIPYLNQGL